MIYNSYFLFTCLPLLQGSGRSPPMMHRQSAPEGRGQKAASAGYSRAHNPEASAKAKGTGIGTGGKSNLAGQIIPVYGFGILFYILYILFKVKYCRHKTQHYGTVRIHRHVGY